MSNTTPETRSAMSAAQCIAKLSRSTDFVVRVNLEGVTHEESLMMPHEAGNCANWVLGHLINIYSSALPVVGQQPVLELESIAQYARGSAALQTAHAIDLTELNAAWKETSARFIQGASTMSDEQLAQRAPFSPSNNPDETVHSLLLTVAFHQAYHSGQLGVLRRVMGHEGAIK